MTPIAVTFALLIGITLGLLGAGGSAITVPVFVYVLGMDPKEAIASSLSVVAAVALAGAIRHWRAGNLDASAAMAFTPTAVAGAFAGARAAGYISGTVQITVFAVVMFIAAAIMFRDSMQDCESGLASLPIDRTRSFWTTGVVGFGVGVMTGVVGVGGGFLIVPALVLLTRIPMKRAIGTSLAVIAANAASGFAGYVGQLPIQWGLITAFAGTAVLGIFMGAALSQRMSHAGLRRGFAVFLAVVAVFVLTSQVRGQRLHSSNSDAKRIDHSTANGGEANRR